VTSKACDYIWAGSSREVYRKTNGIWPFNKRAALNAFGRYRGNFCEAANRIAAVLKRMLSLRLDQSETVSPWIEAIAAALYVSPKCFGNERWVHVDPVADTREFEGF